MTLYRLLLWLFPRRVRRDFGDDMTRLFEAQLAEARQQGGSVLRLWCRAAADAVWHGSVERAIEIRRLGAAISAAKRQWRWCMAALLHDLRYAVRMLFRQPGTTTIAILTLAIGIGANAAIVSAVDALLLRPLPYHDPDRLVMIWEKRQAESVYDNVVAPADYLDWVRMSTAFESMAGYASRTVDVTGTGEAVRLIAANVSPQFFDLLGVGIAHGRTFRADEAEPGRPRVAILSHGLWRRRFGGDPAVIGRTIMLNGVAGEIVGVLPPTFEFPDQTIDLWTPLVLTGGPEPPSRGNHFLHVYARLAPGTSLEQARAEMDRIGGILSRDYPESNRNHGAFVIALRDQLTQPVRSSLLLLLAAVGFVLLIACVNVANLLLARATTRRNELAIRAALGASRIRLAAQALVESLVLGLAGGVSGLIVARWSIDLLRGLTPESLLVVGRQHLGLDRRLLAFTVMLSLGTSVVFGLLPAWHFASQRLEGALREGARTQGGLRQRVRRLLVVSEVALATLLLVGAGLTIRSFQTVLRTEAGMRTDRILTASVTLPSVRYRGDEKAATTFEDLAQRFRSIPGVRSVAATSALPLSGQDQRRSLDIEGYESTAQAPSRAHARSVTVDYFTTMNMHLVSGRTFAVSDRPGAPLVVIVNETMARRYLARCFAARKATQPSRRRATRGRRDGSRRPALGARSPGQSRVVFPAAAASLRGDDVRGRERRGSCGAGGAGARSAALDRSGSAVIERPNDGRSGGAIGRRAPRRHVGAGRVRPRRIGAGGGGHLWRDGASRRAPDERDRRAHDDGRPAAGHRAIGSARRPRASAARSGNRARGWSARDAQLPFVSLRGEPDGSAHPGRRGGRAGVHGDPGLPRPCSAGHECRPGYSHSPVVELGRS